MLRRLPSPPLRPFVELLWVAEDEDGRVVEHASRERVLPTGAMHLVVRLDGDPVRLFTGPGDPTGTALAPCVVGGARAEAYLRSASPSGRSAGAMLRPGASELLFRVPASGLAARHTPLADLWGEAATREAHERLAQAGTPAQRLDALESLLAARLPRVHGLHPAVAEALALAPSTADVAPLVARSGYSHRRFIALFRDAVGLTPKLYLRVLRFQRALAHLRAPSSPPLAGVALAAGYADQAHLTREFVELSGCSPGRYRRLAPPRPNHVPVG